MARLSELVDYADVKDRWVTEENDAKPSPEKSEGLERLPDDLMAMYQWHLKEVERAAAEEGQAQQLLAAAAQRRAGMQQFASYLTEERGYRNANVSRDGVVTRGQV